MPCAFGLPSRLPASVDDEKPKAARRPLEKPVAPSGGLVILRGNAVVFDNYEEMQQRIDDPALEVDASSVLVLRNAGPQGGPGMPEWGQLPIPKKLLEAGVRDMLRISDARMSGTSYGACVLHVAPEAFIGGPLALVKDGDEIEFLEGTAPTPEPAIH